jgi:DNA ligase N terminus
MLDEVDWTLDQIAFTCEFSSVELRERRRGEPTEVMARLIRLFRRGDSLQAKWLIQLIQKDLRPAVVSEITILRWFYVWLPASLALYDSLYLALQLFNDPGHRNDLSHLPETGVDARTIGPFFAGT